MEWKIESKDNSIAIFLESTTNTMTGLRIHKLPENGIIDLNEIPGSEDIRVINCRDTYLPFVGIQKIQKLILPRKANDVKRMELIHYDYDDDSVREGLELDELVWSDHASTIPERFCETCSFCRISNINSVKELGISAFFRSRIEEFAIPPKVKEIPLGCFSHSCLQKISNLDNIETVGSGAFDNCSCLREIQWPQRCREIPSMCFTRCVSLLDVGDISHVVSIGDEAFLESGVKTFRWPEKCTDISYMCFAASALSEIKGIEGVKCIEPNAFFNCLYLTEFNWPSKTVQVPEQCFAGCCSLEKISGVENVTKVGPLAFYGCGFVKFSWPQNCKSIPAQCFNQCNGLAEISGIDNVEEIGSEAFSGCGFKAFKWPVKCPKVSDRCFCDSSLERIDNLNNVESIGAGAFAMTKLKKFDWPQKSRKISESCFVGCGSLHKIKGLDRIISIEADAFKYSGISEIDLENSICVSIGEFAFAGSQIKKFTPGYYTKYIQKNAFYGTTLS